ncbi:MAG TPA: methyltransferase domain-containing protein [Candidatus Acidoferrales bacterium]|nr:methyltransferase domain-containing protein [Candidatus Acidoferrales bacterium]
MKTLYEYYRDREMLPTFAGFEDEAQLTRYEAMRARVLRDRLCLPPQVFAGARVLDYGPDTGEDALVFARWGARLSLVEPNELAHPTIRSYFERFGLASSIEKLVKADVLTYTDARPYDVVVAEGFIYTVQPTRAWLEAFRRRLSSDGIFLVGYYERFGAFVELCLKALHAAFRRMSGMEPVESARRLYEAKWNSIPHTRKFESWVFDVLENPFVRAGYFIEASSLLREAAGAGFDLYASFPVYRDPLTMGWHKAPIDPQRALEQSTAHIERSALSFLVGKKLYLAGAQDAQKTSAIASDLVNGVDALVEQDSTAGYADVAHGFEALLAAIAELEMVADADARAEAAQTLSALARAFALAASGDGDGLAQHAQGNQAFIAAWGVPTHFAVARALGA